MNFKPVAVVFILLTVIFAGATAYSLAYPSSTTRTVVSTQTTTATQTVTPTSSGSASSPFTVGIAYKQGLGYYLTNSSGYALYYRSTDKPDSGTTTCNTATCEKNWPVFYVSSLNLAPGLNSSAFSSITAYNSTKIVTYYGYPLFYWVDDTKPGDTTGQGVGGFYVATVPVLAASAGSTVSTSSTSGVSPYAAEVQIPSGASDNQTSLGNLGFYPNAIMVVIGVNNTVVWTNNDVVMHTVTSLSIPASAQAFNHVLDPGNTYSVTFTVPGTYRYHCNIHPWMFGTVIVES